MNEIKIQYRSEESQILQKNQGQEGYIVEFKKSNYNFRVIIIIFGLIFVIIAASAYWQDGKQSRTEEEKKNSAVQKDIKESKQTDQQQKKKFEQNTKDVQKQKVQNVQQKHQTQKKPVSVQRNKHKENNPQQQVKTKLNKGQNLVLTNQTVFCIINIGVNSEQSLLNQFESIIKQNYKIWKAIFYVNPNLQLSTQLDNPNTKIIDSMGNKGKNIYNSIVNECKEQSIIITLKDGQTLSNQFALSQIEKQLTKGQYYALVSPYEFKGKQVHPNPQIFTFTRDQYFPLYQNKSNLTLVNEIMSHVRVFKASMYLRVPFIELMYQNQTFFETQFSYILPILELNAQHYTATFKYPKNFSLIKQRLLLSSIILYSTSESISLQNNNVMDQINIIGQRVKFPPYGEIINRMKYYKLMRQPYLWTQGKKYNVFKRNISKQLNLIPAIVHQIWIGSQIPDFKKKFMSRFSQVMPQFEYRLWLQEDITQQNFPLTYPYILNLRQIEKKSQYSKLSMIADLMKFQIIYHNGGFYYDTNYEPFLSLNHLRHFPFIGVIQISAFFGQCLATSFFAAEKNSVYLQKLLRSEVLSKIHYDSNLANIQTGPLFLAKAFNLNDYYYKIKVLTPDKFYPYMTWSFDQRRKKSLCSFNKSEQIPSQLQGTYKEVIHAKQFYEIFPCDKRYLGDYGTDHWNLGGTWKFKKTNSNDKQKNTNDNLKQIVNKK